MGAGADEEGGDGAGESAGAGADDDTDDTADERGDEGGDEGGGALATAGPASAWGTHPANSQQIPIANHAALQSESSALPVEPPVEPLATRDHVLRLIVQPKAFASDLAIARPAVKSVRAAGRSATPPW